MKYFYTITTIEKILFCIAIFFVCVSYPFIIQGAMFEMGLPHPFWIYVAVSWLFVAIPAIMLLTIYRTRHLRWYWTSIILEGFLICFAVLFGFVSLISSMVY